MIKITIIFSLLITIPGTSFCAVDFNGAAVTGSVLTCGTVDNIMTENGALTISVYVCPDGFGGGGLGRIVERGTLGVSGARFTVQTTNSTMLFAVAGSTQLSRTAAINSITLGNCYNLIVTWDGGTLATGINIYINGIETTYSSSVNGATLADNSTTTLHIGNSSTSARTFDGRIEELYLWSSVISSQEITQLSKSRVRGIGKQISPSTLMFYAPLDNCGHLQDCTTTGQFLDLVGFDQNCTGANSATGSAGLNYSYL